MTELVPARLTHVGPIATRMRGIDVEECAAFGHKPKQALRNGLFGSLMAWTVMVDGKPEGMMGVVTSSLLDSEGSIWLLMTDKCARQHKALMGLPKIVLPAIHKHYRLLHNRVHADNHRTIRWLERLGFEVGPVEDFNGYPMRRFERRA